jgi:hypothetical protein
LRYGSCVRALALVIAAAAGCGGTAPTSSGPTGSYGFGAPTLEVTVNGVHFGPAAPDPGSAADLNTVHDALGASSGSTFSFNASAAGAACAGTLQRFGAGAAPIVAAAYQLAAAAGDATPDGTVAPVGAQRAVVSAGAWQCAGSLCDGGVFSLTYLNADHVEGFLSAGMQSESGGPAAEVVCSFYLPMRTYLP